MTLDTKYNDIFADLEPVNDQSIIWMSPVISSFVLERMKNVKSLDIFKQEIKKITVDECPCKICKECVKGLLDT